MAGFDFYAFALGQGANPSEPGFDPFRYVAESLGFNPAADSKRSRSRVGTAAKRGLNSKTQYRAEYQQRKERARVRPPTGGPVREPNRRERALQLASDIRTLGGNDYYHETHYAANIQAMSRAVGWDAVLRILAAQLDAMIGYQEGRGGDGGRLYGIVQDAILDAEFDELLEPEEFDFTPFDKYH